jgi:O-antigen ligase
METTQENDRPAVGWAVALGLLWVTVIWGSSNAFAQPTDGFKDAVFYSGAGLLGLATLLFWGRPVPLPPSVRWPAVALAACWIPAWLRADALSGDSVHAALRLMSVVLIIRALVALGRPTLRIVSMVSVAACALGAAAAFVDARLFRLFNDGPSYLTPIGHVTYFGDVMAIQAPLAFLLSSQASRPRERIAWSIAGGLLLVGVWVSGTRASAVGVVVGALLALALRRGRPSLKMMATGGGVALVLLLVGLSTVDRARSDIKIRSERGVVPAATPMAVEGRKEDRLDRLTTGRWFSWGNALAMSMDRPWTGFGVGMFRYDYPEYAHRRGVDPYAMAREWYTHPHNEWLNQLAETGIPGLIALVMLVAGLVRLGWGKLAVDDEAALARTALAGLATAMVCWSFSTSGWNAAARLALVPYVVLLLPAGRALQESAARPLRRVAVTSGLVAVVVATVSYELSHAMAFAARNQERGSSEALEMAHASVRLGPGSYDALSTLSVNLAVTNRAAQQAVNADLLRRFPHVPLVLYQAAIDAARRRELEPARRYSAHAVANGPDLKQARDLHDSLMNIKEEDGGEKAEQ